MKEFKEMIRVYKAATEEADKAEMLWDEDITNDALEQKFDEAYKKQYEAFENLVNLIVKTINCEASTARAMVMKQLDSLERLAAKVA